MKPSRSLLWICSSLLIACLCNDAPGQLRFRRSAEPAQSTQRRTRVEGFRARASDPTDPSRYRESCYRAGTVIPPAVSAPFLATEFQWVQAGGPGTPVTITYSYSNLLGGTIATVTDSRLRAATEEALAAWAAHVPLNFVEVQDTGPLPTPADTGYPTSTSADIRFGAHTIDGATGGELAHAFFPFSTTDGLAGDLHLDVDEDWTQSDGGFLLEVILHELGHTLGLDHVNNVDAIMNPFIANRYTGLGQAALLPDDISGIQSIYGAGAGSVTPLTTTGPTDPPTDTPPADEPTGTDLQAVFDEPSGRLTITGTADNNSLAIYSGFWFTAVVGMNGSTLNGDPGVLYSARATKSIEFDTGSGNDSILLWGLRADNVTATLGAGDDSAAIIFSRIGTLTFDGGEGTNRLWKLLTWISTNTVTGFQ